LQLLLIKLESNNLFAETTSKHSKKDNNTASLSSLAAIIGLKNFLDSSNTKSLINKPDQLSMLLSVLLRYLAGWLYVDAPTSVINTKYGYVPNRAAQKINPYMEVYSVLINVLQIIESNIMSSLLNDTVRIETLFISSL
jgi:hypothetical protein